MSQIIAYTSPVKNISDRFMFSGAIALVAALGFVIISSIFSLGFNEKLLANIFVLLALVGLVVGAVSMFVSIPLQAVEFKRNLSPLGAWAATTYPETFNATQISALANGKVVYVNDDGVTRDAARLVYRDDFAGKVVEFINEAAPRLTPTTV